MNQDTPKNTDTTETETTEGTSRRQFLTGGAAVLLGAATSVIASDEGKAEHQSWYDGPGVYEDLGGGSIEKIPEVDYSANEELAAVIVAAWVSEPAGAAGFRHRLLSYPGLGTHHAPPAGTGQYNKVKGAFAEVGFNIEMPVVLTQTQYNNGYLKGDRDEVVFVLPDQYPPVGGVLTTGALARKAMAAVPFGM